VKRFSILFNILKTLAVLAIFALAILVICVPVVRAADARTEDATVGNLPFPEDPFNVGDLPFPPPPPSSCNYHGQTWPNCYYVDWNGSDLNSGVDEAHPFQHGPGMTGAGGNVPSAATVSAGGYAFIFKGGVTWPASVMGWSPPGGNPSSCGGDINGFVSGASCNYHGIDLNWHTGASWTHPVFSCGGAVCPNNSGVMINEPSNAVVDGFELTGFFWTGGNYAYCSQNSIVCFGAGRHTMEFTRFHIHGWTHDPFYTVVAVNANGPGIVAGGTLTANAAASTLCRSTGSFITDGYVIGDSPVYVTGFQNANNNTPTQYTGGLTVSNVTAGCLTFSGVSFTNEGPISLWIPGSLTSGTFTVGEQIKQTTTLATANVNVAPVTGRLYIGSGYGGTPNATSTWVGQASGAVWTPTGLPGGGFSIQGTFEANLMAGSTQIPNDDLNSSIHDGDVDGSDGDTISGAAIFGGVPHIYNVSIKNVQNAYVGNGITDFHDSTITNINESFTPMSHENALENNASCSNFIYNLYISHVWFGAVGLWNAINQGCVGYVFNVTGVDWSLNNFLDLAHPVTNNGCAHGQSYCTNAGASVVFNSTFELGPDSGPVSQANIFPVANATYDSGWDFHNNHWIGNTAPQFTCNPSNYPCPSLASQLGNIQQTVTQANASGCYTNSTPFWFTPGGSGCATVGAGASNATVCANIAALNSPAGAACLKSTSAGVSVDPTTHLVTGLALTPVARCTGSNPCDSGAYQRAASQAGACNENLTTSATLAAAAHHFEAMAEVLSAVDALGAKRPFANPTETETTTPSVSAIAGHFAALSEILSTISNLAAAEPAGSICVQRAPS